ncbi:hypothetical protein Tco_0776692, partial [Tanacetum coccineum]
DAEVARLLAISTPPSSPLSPWSSPLPQIPSPPLPSIPSPSLPLSPPLPVSAPPPASPIRAPSSGTPPLHLLSTDRREDRPEVTLPPRKRLGIALGPTYEVGESSSAAAARPVGGLRDEIFEAMQGTPVVTDVAEFSQRITEFETRVRRDTDEVYTRDRRAHARTARLMETGARMSRLGDDLWMRETDGDYRDVGGRSQEAEAAHRGTEADKETSDSDGKAMINQGITSALQHVCNTNSVDQPQSQTATVLWKTKSSAPLVTLWKMLKWGTPKLGPMVIDIAYAITWNESEEEMTDIVLPRTVIRNHEVEYGIESERLRNMSVAYPTRYMEVVVASSPKEMQEAAGNRTLEVMDKRIRTFADRQT